MRSDWDVINATRTEPIGFLWGLMVGNALWVLLLLLSGCVLVRPWAPSGKPGCASGHQWSDSAQKCVPKPPRAAAKGEG